MKKTLVLLCMTLTLLLGTLPMSAMAAEGGEEKAAISTTGTQVRIKKWESDHPALSESLKKAIAFYKRNPTEESKQVLLLAINNAYDQIIQTKKDNRAGYIQIRDCRIKGWMGQVLGKTWPRFMLLSTDNNKGFERQVVADAVNAYWEAPNSSNRVLVREALEQYYDAFLKEQDEVVAKTETARETRVSASLAYYTSDLFQIHTGVVSTVKQEEVLAEVICEYISTGAEIKYCNPEARVTEREINASIYEARVSYLDNPSEENKASLVAEISQAFQTAYDARVEGLAAAEKKDDRGANLLFGKLQDADYVANAFKELTEQRNLYGRIDRTVVFGSNTYGVDWTPRMLTESRELAILLHEYQVSPTDESLQAAKEKYLQIYEDMLAAEKKQLDDVGTNIDSLVEDAFCELAGTGAATESAKPMDAEESAVSTEADVAAVVTLETHELLSGEQEINTAIDEPVYSAGKNASGTHRSKSTAATKGSRSSHTGKKSQ